MAESYILHSSNPLEEKCLDLANHLLYVCKIPLPLVESIKDINSNLIVALFESITSYNIPDFVHSENTIEEAHNVQAVIDTLSLDLLGISLSHITGEDVVSGDLLAIFNLLEVFEGLLLFISSEDEVDSNMAGGTAFSSKRKRSIEKFKSFISEESGQSHLKPMKMKRYTKYKNKVIISSDSEKSSDKHQSLHSTNKNICINQDQNANRKDRSCLASLKDKNNDKARGKHPLVVEKLHGETEKSKAAKENFTFNGVKLKRKIAKINDVTIFNHHKNQSVEDLFEKNFGIKVKAFLESKNSPRNRASQMKRNRLKDLKKPVRKPSLTPCRKSFLLPYNLRRRSVSHGRTHVPAVSTRIYYGHSFSKSTSPHRNDAEAEEIDSKVRSVYETVPKRIHVSTSENPETSANVKDGNLQKTSGAAFIKNWMNEFPGLKIPNDVLNRANKQHEQQLMSMHKKLRNTLLMKTKSHKQAEEAAKKQLLLSNLLKKEINQYRHLNEVKLLKANENKIKYRLRDARLQSANMKHYCDEFHHEMRKKMQKRNYSEELVAENVFKEVLKIQQDQVQQLCEDVKEADALDAKHHKNYLDALENLYQTNYALLTEVLADEENDVAIQTDAFNQAMRKRKVELNRNLRKEIRVMQKNIVEAMQDTHFRELDAEQYKCKMRKKFS